MSISEYVAIFSVIAVITGWFISGYVNRKNAIAEKLLNYRMMTLRMVLDVKYFIEKNKNPFSDPDFLPLIENTRKNMTLYGEIDEIDFFESFIHSCEKGNETKALGAINNITLLAVERIRAGLGLKSM